MLRYVMGIHFTVFFLTDSPHHSTAILHPWDRFRLRQLTSLSLESNSRPLDLSIMRSSMFAVLA